MYYASQMKRLFAEYPLYHLDLHLAFLLLRPDSFDGVNSNLVCYNKALKKSNIIFLVNAKNRKLNVSNAYF
jgi:hypothetical protein